MCYYRRCYTLLLVLFVFNDINQYDDKPLNYFNFKVSIFYLNREQL